MPSLNIAILGADPQERASAAQSIGKKGTADDVGFYHTVYSGTIVSVAEPAAYPAKFQSLLQAIALSDHILVLAGQPTPQLGEIIIALDLLGRDAIFVSENDLSPFLSATSLKGAKISPSLQEAKEHILSQQASNVPGSTQIPIDHCFEVKGVGTVALGLVKRGGVKVHDTLVSYPSGTEIQVRTIQRNDVDVQSAECGDRVGLSLKGAKSEQVERGSIFAAEPMNVSNEISCELSVAKFSKTAISNGMALHVGCNLQFEPAKIECAAEIKQGSKGNAKLILQKPVAFNNGDRLLICDLNAKGLRAIAGAKPL
jgi:selenocysteine-specific translation elongation factor